MNTGLTRIFRSRGFQFGAGLIVSALFFYLAAREVNFGDTWAAILKARFSLVALALASVATNTMAKVLRWKDLLGENGLSIPVRKLLSALLIGQMLNTLFPARVGDLSRAYTIGGMGPGRPFTLGTVVIEKMVDLLAYVLLVFTLLLWIPLPDWVSSAAMTLVGTAVAFASLVFLLTHQRERLLGFLSRIADHLPGTPPRRAWELLQNGIASTEILQNPATALKVIFWSLLVWGTAVLTNHLTLLALQMQLPLIASILLLVALQAGITLPAVPGRIGLFEYICVLALGLFGVEQPAAFTYGVLLHAIVLVPSTAIGLLAFWFSGLAGAKSEPLNVPESP